MAAGIEFRAPTGDEQDLLGLGAAQAKFSFIASADFGGFSPHWNIGYKISGDPPDAFTAVDFPELVGVDAPTNPSVTRENTRQLSLEGVDVAPDEWNYAIGFDTVISPRVSLAVDVIGRRLIDAGRLREFPFEHNFRIEGTDGNVLRDDGPVESTTFQQLFLDRTSVNQVFGAFGVKINVGSTFLLSANVLVALTDEGLRDDFVPIIGFDYVF